MVCFGASRAYVCDRVCPWHIAIVWHRLWIRGTCWWSVPGLCSWCPWRNRTCDWPCCLCWLSSCSSALLDTHLWEYTSAWPRRLAAGRFRGRRRSVQLPEVGYCELKFFNCLITGDVGSCCATFVLEKKNNKIPNIRATHMGCGRLWPTFFFILPILTRVILDETDKYLQKQIRFYSLLFCYELGTFRSEEKI